MTGFYNLLKPPGMTAHDVVAVARKRLGTKRIGHGGTLDPLAAGVLPLAVGPATRLLPYLPGDKEYLAEVAFGRATTTGDAAGSVVAEQEVHVTRGRLRDVLGRFVGPVSQVPPAHSAIHVGGRRAYDLARGGLAVELPPRTVVIHALELLRFEPRAGRLATAWLRVACSRGTYVRSLAVDIGAALGAPAHLAFLLRTRAGSFGIADATLLAEDWRPILPAVALAHLPVVEVSDAEAEALRNGRPIRPGTPEAADVEFVGRAQHAGGLVAIVVGRAGALWPRTVLA